MWRPISREKIDDLIFDTEVWLSSEERAIWNNIKINPQKWQEPQYGPEDGGFWVVAIFGKRVIWYNDIEDGFNVSSYMGFGVLAQYGCNQSELGDTIRSLVEEFRPATN